MEFRWPPDYPTMCGPTLNLDLFYNKNLIVEAKEKILTRLKEEMNNLSGIPMTFSLIEFIKENFDDLLSEQPLQIVNASTIDEAPHDSVSSKNVEKKEHLSKAQKRKMWDRGEGGGEKERGWNWVDIIKHLSQSGGADNQP